MFLGDGTTIIQWNPIPILSEGSNFRTHSLFFNDTWRVNNRLTANLGVRYDKNDGEESGAASWSPRTARSARGSAWSAIRRARATGR